MRVVVICDDHPLIRAGMAGAPAMEPELVVARQVADVGAAAAVLAGYPEAVLVVRDTLLGAASPPPVDMVIGVDQPDAVRVLAHERVRALIRRSGPPEDIRQATLAVARGAGFIAPDLVLPVLHLVRDRGTGFAGPEPVVNQLTTREREGGRKSEDTHLFTGQTKCHSSTSIRGNGCEDKTLCRGRPAGDLHRAGRAVGRVRRAGRRPAA